MSYQVEFAKPAAKQFKALPDQEKRKLQPKIDSLATNPRPSGVIKLKLFNTRNPKRFPQI